MASTFETPTHKPSKQDALDYHSSGRKGKIEVVPTKPCATARDLSLAYSPGVAEPCLAIEQEQELSYKYTARGNLVGVISNGTAVLGLGDIGAYASKPVMEGKAVLFKKFADIDVFDLEVDLRDVDGFCRVVKEHDRRHHVGRPDSHRAEPAAVRPIGDGAVNCVRRPVGDGVLAGRRGPHRGQGTK